MAVVPSIRMVPMFEVTVPSKRALAVLTRMFLLADEPATVEPKVTS